MGAEVGDISEFPLPRGLSRLMALGIWPSKDGPLMTVQHFDPIVRADRVSRFAPDETLICLSPPPFRTIAAEKAKSRSGDFWERFGALNQIVPEKALVIGDFGLGSDAPIVLDYHRSMADPPVLRLRWTGQHTEWVEGARNFDHFAELLGLSDRSK